MIAPSQKTKRLGSFQLDSGHLRITDPYAPAPLGPLGTLPVARGRWGSYAVFGPHEDRGILVHELLAAKMPYDPRAITAWKLESFSVAVFSGLCGMVDDRDYPENGYDGTEVIEKILRLTQEPGSAALLRSGVFSLAGWKNAGRYDIYTAVRVEDVEAVRIVFLEPEKVPQVDERAILLAMSGD